MTTIDKVKQWFIDRDLETGGRLDKHSVKSSASYVQAISRRMSN